MNGVLIISVGLDFFYNMVANIAIEYPSGIVSSNSHVWNTGSQHHSGPAFSLWSVCVSPGTLRHCLLAPVSSNDADCLENLQS